MKQCKPALSLQVENKWKHYKNFHGSTISVTRQKFLSDQEVWQNMCLEHLKQVKL